MKTCPNGHSVPDDAKFCTECGAVMPDIPLSEPAQGSGQYAQPQQPNGAEQQGYQQYDPNQQYQQYPPGQQGYQQYDPNQQYQQYPPGQQGYQQYDPNQQYQQYPPGQQGYQQYDPNQQYQQYPPGQQGYQQYDPNQQYQQYPPGQQGYQQYDPNQQYQQYPPGQQGYQQYDTYQAQYGGVQNMPLTGFRGTVRSPGMVIFLSIITCGIYGIYWLYTASTEINSVLGYEATKPVYSVVSILCFVFSYVLMSQIDKALMEINRKRGRFSESKFLIWILLTIFIGVGIFLMQYEVQSTLNELYEGR